MMQSLAFTRAFKEIKLEELLLYLLQSDPEKLLSLKSGSRDEEELQLKKAVESNIGSTVTLEELAFLCNCSLSTFKRKFNKIYQMPPQKWLIQQKMILAARLLSHANETAGTVYQQVGYENSFQLYASV